MYNILIFDIISSCSFLKILQELSLCNLLPSSFILILIFWVVMPWYGGMFLKHTGINLHVYIALHPRIPTSLPPQETKISYLSEWPHLHSTPHHHYHLLIIPLEYVVLWQNLLHFLPSLKHASCIYVHSFTALLLIDYLTLSLYKRRY